MSKMYLRQKTFQKKLDVKIFFADIKFFVTVFTCFRLLCRHCHHGDRHFFHCCCPFYRRRYRRRCKIISEVGVYEVQAIPISVPCSCILVGGTQSRILKSRILKSRILKLESVGIRWNPWESVKKSVGTHWNPLESDVF